MRFKLIITFVKPNICDKVVDAMKEAGATGATIIPARGTGIHEAKSFFGLSIEDHTEIILFIVEEHVVEKFMTNTLKHEYDRHSAADGPIGADDHDRPNRSRHSEGDRRVSGEI